MHNNKSRYFDWAFCFSLPTILMTKNWDILVFRNVNKEYFSYQPNAVSYLGAILLVAAMALVTALGLRGYRRSDSKTLRWMLSGLFLASFIVVLGFVRESQGIGLNWLNGLRYRFGGGNDAVLFFVIVLIGLACVYYLRFIARAAFVLVIALTPFSLGIVVQAGWGAANSKFPESHAGSVATEPAERKVVLLLFDALDTRVLFEHRPEGWDFAAFDKLRSEAFYAPNASAPGGPTLRAIPALLTGKAVTESTIQPGPDLEIRFADGGEGRLRSVETIFNRADELGFDSAVVGFYHPYCQLFRQVLVECLRVARKTPELEPPRNLLTSMRRQLLGLSVLNSRQAAIASYEIIRNRGIRLARQANIDFLFIHAPVPHAPPIYDAKKGAFTKFNRGLAGYIENVALADRFLAEFRQEMEADGSWDDLTLIITADHGWSDRRYFNGDKNEKVPFLVKLPDQDNAVEYSDDLSALVIADLVVETLTGRISRPAELTTWLWREQSSRKEAGAAY